MDSKSFMGVIMAAIMLAAFAWALASSREEQDQWEDFRRVHECKVTRKVKSEVIVGSDGHVYTSPATTCWTCDDGVEYCR